MSHFHKQGNMFRVVPEEAMDIRPKLPAGTYIVGADPGGFYLEHTEDFNVKGKLYGDLRKNSERILKTYLDRPQSTGILLAGEKGSGKTLLAKLVSQDAAKDHNIPTLIVTRPYHGDGFNGLMQGIAQPCIVVFDEFEKVYDNDQQQAILTLMDGLLVTQKLFILTVNDHWKVNDHMKNRPGRLFYRLDFDGLSEAFIRGYCEDNLDNKEHIDALCRSLVLFEKFNFDMLKALVEEMNRWKEGPQDSMKYLNIRPDIKKDTYDIKTTLDGIEVPNSLDDRFHGNPFMDTYNIGLETPAKAERQKVIKDLRGKGKTSSEIAAVLKTMEEGDSVLVAISPEKITKVDARQGLFVYNFPEEEAVVTLRKKPPQSFDYYKYMD